MLNRTYLDIAIAILELLHDAEYHTITATTLHIAKHFHLTSDEMRQVPKSRLSKNNNLFTSTRIYTETVLVVSHLRRAKLVKDFPKSKNIGFFAITEKGLLLSQKSSVEIKKSLNLELKKFKNE